MKFLFIILMLFPLFSFSQKVQKLKIKEVQFSFDKEAHVYPGKRLPIGIRILAYKKSPDKAKEYLTPKGVYPKGNISWGEFDMEIKGAKFNKSKGELIVDDNINLSKVEIKITNRFNENVEITETIFLDYGGKQKIEFMGEAGQRGLNGIENGKYLDGSQGKKTGSASQNHQNLYGEQHKKGQAGENGERGEVGDSLEIFINLKKEKVLGNMLHIQIINKTKNEIYLKKINPNKEGLIEIISAGGKGGKGGKGSKGKSEPYRSTFLAGNGGAGGNGGDGGKGGIIICYIDISASKYKNLISLLSVGGPVGEGGKGGAAGTKQQEDHVDRGKTGAYGSVGSVGESGPEPIIKIIELQEDW